MVKEEITDDEGGDHKLPHNTLVNKITEEVVDEDGTVHDNSAEGMGICFVAKICKFFTTPSVIYYRPDTDQYNALFIYYI